MKQKEQILVDLQWVQTDEIEKTYMQVKDLNKELLLLRLSFGKLKAAIRDAFAPIAAVVVPAITAVVRWATGLIKTFGQIVAGVLGIDVAQQKLEKTVVRIGKAVQRTVMGFDQLNRLQDTSAGGVKTYTTEAPMPETMPVSDKVQETVNKIRAMLAPLQEFDTTALRWQFERLKESVFGFYEGAKPLLESLWKDVLVPFFGWVVEQLAPMLLQVLSYGIKLLTQAVILLGDGFAKLLEVLKPVFAFIGEVVLTALEGVRKLFANLRLALIENGNAIRDTFDTVAATIAAMWEKAGPIAEKLRLAFGVSFADIAKNMRTMVGELIGSVKALVTDISGPLIEKWSVLWDGIGKSCEGVISFVVGLINKMLSSIADGINGAVKMVNKLSFKVPDWVPEIGGKDFGFNLKTVTAPTIPYLAKGAVLPANQPFLAVVGDQKHGTNIEAPLSTIQEAVALTMEDMAAGNLAGHQATVNVLRDILQAVLGIRIGDEQIGQAARRYDQKMAVMHGGAMW